MLNCPESEKNRYLKMKRDEPIRNKIVCRPKVAIARLCTHLLPQMSQERERAIVITANSIEKTRSLPDQLYASCEPILRNIFTGVTLSCRANKPLNPIKAVEEIRIPVIISSSYAIVQKIISVIWLRGKKESVAMQKSTTNYWNLS